MLDAPGHEQPRSVVLLFRVPKGCLDTLSARFTALPVSVPKNVPAPLWIALAWVVCFGLAVATTRLLLAHQWTRPAVL
jgi:hypothetical protein